MTTTLAATMRKQMVTHLVSKNIVCPRTGAVLDARTCVVLTDRDGDPAAVVSPAGWEQISNDPDTLARLASHGLTVDATTVPTTR